MWAKIVEFIFGGIFGSLVQMWESNKRDATNIKRGADEVIRGQLEDENKRLRDAIDVINDVHDSDDNSLDSGMRRPPDS